MMGELCSNEGGNNIRKEIKKNLLLWHLSIIFKSSDVNY